MLESLVLFILLAPFAGRPREAEGGRDDRKLRVRLLHAGYRSPGASVVFRGSRVILVLGLPLVGT